MDVPGHLAHGPESAFWTMCYIAEHGLKLGKMPRKNTDTCDPDSYNISQIDDNPYGREYNDHSVDYGGFVINFDLKIILLGCDFMLARQKLDVSRPFDNFYWYPKHRNALIRVIEEFWVGWRVYWIREEEFLQYSVAEIEFDEISTAADVLPQHSHWQDKCLHIPQGEIEDFYREEFRLFRSTTLFSKGDSVKIEPFVIDSVHQEIFEYYVAEIDQRLRQT